MNCKCKNELKRITSIKIEHTEIGKGKKIICGDCNCIIQQSFLCWTCSKPLSEEEVERYRKLKRKILTSQMVCSDCKKHMNSNIYKY